VLDKLCGSGVTHACLAVSFQWQKFSPILGDRWNGLPLSYSIEPEPLGTGGAARQAVQEMGWSDSLIVNGDTLIDVNLLQMQQMAHARCADVIVALKQLDNTARFGRVTMGRDLRIDSFTEKGLTGPGLINAGIYWFRADALNRVQKRSFSLERDLMAGYVADLTMYGFVTSGYFVDMGMPEDLERIRRELT
jgi:D-glycero-alpha-D-manno-heptose 1-phosphate guanylyltransferase